MKKLIVFLLLTTTINIYAQERASNIERSKFVFQEKQVIPPSPIAAELGKYGNTPVSLFTGTPTINIPLYELRGNTLSLPISLSYNASGFKPQEVATWVGSGWSLNIGGVITRSVKGAPDTESNYFTANPFDPLAHDHRSIEVMNYMSLISSGHIETQSDTYYYNFAGKSGKFSIRPNNSVIKKSKDMLNVVSGINGMNSHFTITDEQGVVYKFEAVETSVTVPSDDGGGPLISYTYPSSWFLTEIVSADRIEQIVFEYKSPKLTYQGYANTKNNQSYIYEYRTDDVLCSQPYNESNTSVPPTNSIKRQFLSNITMKRNGKVVSNVEVNSSKGREDSAFDEELMVNQIKVNSVSENMPALIKQYDFAYGYFVNSDNVFNKKRLRLDRLTEIPMNSNTTTKPGYKFFYNTETNIPDLFTASLDHWGFFNLAPNVSLVPDVSVPNYQSQGMTIIGGGANRSASLEGSQCAILNKIQYPTGGYTVFEYETHDAVKNLVDGIANSLVGGIRIKRLTDYSFDGQIANIKTYGYLLDDKITSSGNTIWPEYLKATSRGYFMVPKLGIPPVCETGEKKFNVYTVSANSIFGLGSFEGSHIGYSQVTESSTDAIGKSIGKTVYNYRVGLFGEYDDDVRNGNLLKKSIYRNDGKLLSEERSVYGYEVIDRMPAYVLRVGDFQNNRPYYCKTVDGGYSYKGDWESRAECVQSAVIPTRYFLYNYNETCQYNRLDSTIIKTFDPVKNLYNEQIVSYKYDNPVHVYPSRTIQTGSTRNEIVTLNKYAADFSAISANDPVSNAILGLNSLNIGGAQIETIQYRQNRDGSNRRYISGQLTAYKYSGSIPRPADIYELETLSPLNSVASATINNGSFTYDPAYKPGGSFSYDSEGNISEQSKIGSPLTSYLWGYNGLYPIAVTQNSSVNEIAYTSFESSGTGKWLIENVAIDQSVSLSGSRSAVLNSGSKLSRVFAVAPAQFLVSYWSRGGALIVTSNGSIPVSAKEGNEVNGWVYYEHLMPVGTYSAELKTLNASVIIDELRQYPKEAQMKTMAYYPLIGLNTQVSVSNNIGYFDYDGYGRLVNTRNSKREIQQNYVYNYGSGISPVPGEKTLFYNIAAEKAFTKQGCTAGTPEVIIYKVPEHKYAASSQSAADAMAQQEINENGQNNANLKGRCLFYNTLLQRRVFKNDCTPEQGPGSMVFYKVQGGKHAAETPEEAQALAVADLNANAQAYANSAGVCSCSIEGTRYVNGNCETGVMVYVSYSAIGNGQYRCIYKYRFSDNTYTSEYSMISSSPCINN